MCRPQLHEKLGTLSNMHFQFLGFLTFTVSAIATYSTRLSTVVNLGYSKYQGVAQQNGITSWLGIRFAAPPVGNLRFRAPRDPLVNKTLQNADKVWFIKYSQALH